MSISVVNSKCILTVKFHDLLCLDKLLNFSILLCVEVSGGEDHILGPEATSGPYSRPYTSCCFHSCLRRINEDQTVTPICSCDVSQLYVVVRTGISDHVHQRLILCAQTCPARAWGVLPCCSVPPGRPSSSQPLLAPHPTSQTPPKAA